MIDGGQIEVPWLAFFRIQRTVAILGYGDFEIDNDRPLGVVSAFQFQISN